MSLLALHAALYLVSNPKSYVSPASKKFMAEVLEMKPGVPAPDQAAASAQLRLSHNQSRPWEARLRGSAQPSDGEKQR